MLDAEVGDNSQIEVDFDQLESFLSELTDKKKTITEANGRLRSNIKTILEETGWHKAAFAMIRSIDAKSETERADFLRSFDPLFQAMKEFKWADEMDDLFNDQESGGEE